MPATKIVCKLRLAGVLKRHNSIKSKPLQNYISTTETPSVCQCFSVNECQTIHMANKRSDFTAERKLWKLREGALGRETRSRTFPALRSANAPLFSLLKVVAPCAILSLLNDMNFNNSLEYIHLRNKTCMSAFLSYLLFALRRVG